MGADQQKVENVETEVKIEISENEYKCLKSFLDDKAKFVAESRQVDTYYQPTYRKFLKDGSEMVNEWLRIGMRGGRKILNYKNWHDNKHCDEYETEVTDEKSLDKILRVLGLEEITTVDKTRRTYSYLDKYEIALDYVKNLGYFIEIEVKEYGASALEEYDKLLELARELKLDLNHIDKRGYPYRLIYSSRKVR